MVLGNRSNDTLSFHQRLQSYNVSDRSHKSHCCCHKCLWAFLIAKVVYTKIRHCKLWIAIQRCLLFLPLAYVCIRFHTNATGTIVIGTKAMAPNVIQMFSVVIFYISLFKIM